MILSADAFEKFRAGAREAGSTPVRSTIFVRTRTRAENIPRLEKSSRGIF
jgi:hypothetical protein